MKRYLVLAMLISAGILLTPACKKDDKKGKHKAKVTKVEKAKPAAKIIKVDAKKCNCKKCYCDTKCDCKKQCDCKKCDCKKCECKKIKLKDVKIKKTAPKKVKVQSGLSETEIRKRNLGSSGIGL